MDEELDFLRPMKVFFMDTNLSSPVLLTEIKATRDMLLRTVEFTEDKSKLWKCGFKERQQFYQFRKVCKFNNWTRQTLRQTAGIDPSMYPDLEGKMLLGHESVVSLYTEAKEIAMEIESAVRGGLMKRGLPEESISGTADLLCSSESEQYRHAYEWFCDLFSRAESRVKMNEHAWTFGRLGEVEIWIHSSMALLKVEGKLYHSSLNQILMLKDKIATRFMLIEHVKPLRTSSKLIAHLLSLFRWQDDTLKKYGNHAYEVLKAVEPMFKTRLSHISDNIFGEDTAYTRMIAKMEEKEKKVQKTTGIKGNQIASLISIVESVERTDEIVELFGCLKSCGHPLIDAELGGYSAAEEALSPDTTSLVDAQLLRNTFCHIVLSSYVEQHGEWPPLTYTKAGLTLEIMNSRQERNIKRSSYDIGEWTYVEWNKIFEMDYFPNFLELMDDKSISLYRSEKHLTWDMKPGQKARSERRLLLEVLKRDSIAIESLVRKVSNRDIPFDWFIVSLYPKEREFKLEPRMFAMLCLEMRCFFTCIEANIARHVFKYMPQQTMTKSKTQIQERFLRFTDPTRQASTWKLFLEIDLSRWNLKWRELVVHMVGHDLNRMFGVKGTFTVTHWFFALCQIVVRVGGLRPEGIQEEYPPITGLAWRDHKGGFEGLNQKLWTAVTYAMVEMALQPMVEAGTITSYELIGQGDNQVICATIPVSDKLREEVIPPIRDEMNERLENTCKKVGQTVKPEENVESTTVVTYSKDVYVGGVEYPTTLKKHSRLYPVTATDFPSIGMKAGSIMAGAVAGAENARHPLCSYIVGIYHTARYLLAASRGCSIHGSQFPRLSKDDITTALITPPSIGGMIGTPVASFLYKGGSDPLGKEISSLRLLADGHGDVATIASRALRALEERYYISSNPNVEALIENPYGLPIDKSASPISRVSHLTLDAFRSKVTNKDIRPLLDDKVSRAEQTLKNDILSIAPLNPLLAHDLFDASAFGTIKLMRKMFLTTRTVQTVAQIVNPNITHQFLRSDINDLLWFKKWAKNLPLKLYSGRDTYQLTKQFRSYWGVELHGVTNYQPLDSYHSANTSRHCSSIKWSSHSETDLLTTRGPLSGYLGTATREKRSEHGYKIVDAGAPSRAIMKLQLIRSQAYGDPNFNSLLDRIGLTRTDALLSEITDLLQKVIGGSIAHRYATAIRMMSASYVGPLNFVTHLRLDTDSLGKLSGSTLNYPVMTQEFMIMALIGAKLQNAHRGARIGELIVETERMESLPDDALKAKPPVFKDMLIPKSKLLYTPDLMIARTYDSAVRQVPRGAVAHQDTYHERATIEHAAVGFFLELLRNQNKAKVLADNRGVAAIPASLQLDISEAHAIGPTALTRCMSYAIVTSFLRDAFRTLHVYPDRWDEGLFLVHNISTCVKACAQYWKHPLFASHKDSDRYSNSKLRYNRWNTSDRIIASEVRSHLVNITNDPNHPYWRLPIPVFSGSRSMSLVEVLTTAGAKMLYPLYIEGSSYAQGFGSLFASYTRLNVKKVISPEEQLSLLRARMVKLGTLYSKQDHLVASKIKSLGQMNGVLVFNDDIRTVIRYARGLPLTTRVITPPSRLVLIEPLANADHCSRCRPQSEGRTRIMWNKYSRRPHGGITSSGYTWAPLLSNFTLERQVMIVGCGNGGLADLLLSTYRCDVIGIDLETDLPQESATLMNYFPSSIKVENRARFTESDICLTTNGDWTDNSTRTEILNTIYQRTTIFVDITSPGIEWVRDSVSQSFTSHLVGSIILRLQAYSSQITEVVKTLREDGCSVILWYLSAGVYEDEVIIYVTRTGNHLHQCRSAPAVIYAENTNGDNLILPKIDELIVAACRSSLFRQSESIDEFGMKLHDLCSSLLNKPKGRQLLYTDRISLIIGYSTFYACMSESPISLIQGWISDEMIETDLFRISLRDDFVTHLLRYVPRLCKVKDLNLDVV